MLIMSQTAQSRDWRPEDLGVGVAVIDEAHYERSVTRRWLAAGVPTVGLTATPFAQWMGRAILGQPLDDVWTGPLVAPLTTRQLIAQGVLLAPVMSSEQEDPTELDDPATGKRFERGGGDWSDGEAERIMDPYTTMIAKRWRELCDAPIDEGGYGGDATANDCPWPAPSIMPACWPTRSAASRDPGHIWSRPVGPAVEGAVRPDPVRLPRWPRGRHRERPQGLRRH